MMAVIRRKQLNLYITRIQKPIDQLKKLEIDKYDQRHDYK